MPDYVLELERIVKSFPGVKALNGVDLRVRPATVHGVMGENGAGKSTLMKVAIGLYRPDSGTIRFCGSPVSMATIHASLALGISMILSHFMTSQRTRATRVLALSFMNR